MFAEVKESLPISGDDYDAEIIRQIKACVLDLTTSAEIVLPGEVNITREQSIITNDWVITDNSTLTDELIITVISIWCNMRIGNPPNYSNLQAAYNSLKGQLRLSKSYTQYGDPEPEEEPAEEATTE